MIKEFNYRNYNKIKFYYGVVNEVLENYSVRFRIPEIIDNLDDDEYPIAHPILKHTSEIFKNDTIIIMQLDVDMQEFVYFSNDVTEFTGLRFGNAIIDLSLGKEDNPSLSIKIAELKSEDEDGNDLEEGEEYSVLGPFTDITLNKYNVTILRSEANSDKAEDDQPDVLVTIGKLPDDHLGESGTMGIDAQVYKGGEKADQKHIVSQVTVTNKGEISIASTPDPNNTNKFTTLDIADGNVAFQSDADVQKSATVDVKDGAITLDSNTTAGQATEEMKDGKISLKSSPMSGESTLEMDGNKITITGGQALKATGTFDGDQGVNLASDLTGELDLGVLVELKNTAGGLKGALDDLWTELSTVNQNMITLASMTAAISYAGPGALINSTGGDIGGIAASIGTINAKKALVSATFK